MKRVDADTWFWPVVQSGVLNVGEEERTLGKVWEDVKKGHEVPGSSSKGGEETSVTRDEIKMEARGDLTTKSQSYGNCGLEVDLTSGYFGLYKAYKKAIIDSPAPTRIIAASPKVGLPCLCLLADTRDDPPMNEVVIEHRLPVPLESHCDALTFRLYNRLMGSTGRKGSQGSFLRDTLYLRVDSIETLNVREEDGILRRVQVSG